MRSDLTPLAKPQNGVDPLKDRFKNPTKPLMGITDKTTKP